jgi:hypothetical protein
MRDFKRSSIRRLLRTMTGSGAALALAGSMLTPAVLAAAPERIVIDLNDPAVDADESAWATDYCGFEVNADVRGRITILVRDGSRPGTAELDVYGMSYTYTNVVTGASITFHDVGPDRFFSKDGVRYVAITGRSVGGSGTAGSVIVNLETGEVLRASGGTIEPPYWEFCAAIA